MSSVEVSQREYIARLKGFLICSDELLQIDKFSESGLKEMKKTFIEALLALEQKQKLKVELGYMLDQRIYVDEEKEKVRKETINKIKELI